LCMRQFLEWVLDKQPENLTRLEATTV